MSWGAVIVGGAALASAYISSSGEKKAAETQAGATDAASAAELEMFYQARTDIAPWRRIGKNALATLVRKLEKGPGEFTASPGYEFTLGEGLQGIQRAASAGGRLRSGAHLKAGAAYAEDLASTEYDNFLRRWYNELQPYENLANMGQASATQSAVLSQQTGRDLATNALTRGNAVAAGQLGQANTYSNLLNWGGRQVGDYLQQNELRKLNNNANYYNPYLSI